MAMKLPASEVRQALTELPEVQAQENLDPPDLKGIYVPRSHQSALSLDTSIVVGMRGAGKSLWTAALLSEKHRAYVVDQLRTSAIEKALVRIGFGHDNSNKNFPSPRVLATLSGKVDAFSIWQAVVLRHALASARISHAILEGSWKDAAAWIEEHSEDSDRLMAESDKRLRDNGTPLLILFDALDLLANSWPSVKDLLTAALRVALYCRSMRMIRLKFFLRPDMEEDPEIWKFQDSSKLRQAKVSLDWSRADLYGLLLQHLGNAESCGAVIRKKTTDELDVGWARTKGVFPAPRELTSSDEALRPVVEAITGKWMGSDYRRGACFTWIPTHLSDAQQRVSPRSFLIAFKRAAEHTEDRYPQHGLALHYEAIKQGVSRASEVRVSEITEDYPWVSPLLEAARGLTVPCEPDALTILWKPESLSRLDEVVRDSGKLPPRRYTTDPVRKRKPQVLLDDLVELSVIYRTFDDRINMPDIFRVHAGIGRKGGVRPTR